MWITIIQTTINLLVNMLSVHTFFQFIALFLYSKDSYNENENIFRVHCNENNKHFLSYLFSCLLWNRNVHQISIFLKNSDWFFQPYILFYRTHMWVVILIRKWRILRYVSCLFCLFKKTQWQNEDCLFGFDVELVTSWNRTTAVHNAYSIKIYAWNACMHVCMYVCLCVCHEMHCAKRADVTEWFRRCGKIKWVYYMYTV